MAKSSRALISEFPDLAREFHPTKNADVALGELSSGSKKVIWWRCSQNPEHVWEQSVVQRVGNKDRTCKMCRSLDALHPDLAKQWHPTKNGKLRPLDVLPGTRRLVWWVCPNAHEFEAFITNRVKYPDKCDQCRSLLFMHPDIAQEWHPTKNGHLTPADVAAGSENKVWWRCANDASHEWQAVIYSRTAQQNPNRCPSCPRDRIAFADSLAYRFPEIAKEWHPNKNGDLKPEDVTPGSNKKVFWKCSVNEEHVWATSISNRCGAAKSGCRFCANREATDETSLQRLYPHIANEWHPTKNGELRPRDVTPGSGRKVTWQCQVNPEHVWEAAIYSRISGTGCRLCNAGWTIESIKLLVKSLLPHLTSLTAAELYVIFQQNGVLDTHGKSRSFVKALATGRFPRSELERFCNEESSLVDDFISGDATTLEGVSDDSGSIDQVEFQEVNPSEVGISEGSNQDLPNISVDDVLSSLDISVLASADREAMDYLIASGVSKLWKIAYKDDIDVENSARNFVGGEYATEVRDTFLDELKAARNLPIPEGYDFQSHGKLAYPNLMQRHVAYLVLKKKRVGNWSGTGAGKTLSAIYVSRLVKAKLTVICCPNSVVKGWADNIYKTFPESDVQVKTWNPKWTKKSKYRYLVLNYEVFQQESSAADVEKFCAEHDVNFLVVDEIHYTKQRSTENLSKRRQVITAFSALASKNNEDLCVLGMSATPVINNLFEGRSLIDLITGLEHQDIEVKVPTVANCMRMHQKLVTLGVRWMPHYEPRLDLQEVRVNCEDYLGDIKELGGAGSPLQLEKILTEARLPVILENLQPKTLVYTHYVQGIDKILRDAFVSAGWSVGFYTGEEKSGLDAFIKGDLDILIGSSAIGTGVDGLQTVCNCLILNVLPWTAAEFEQLKGRIYRQGQVKDKVSVIIPVTYANVNGEEWSWCESKLKRLQYKKSIADAVVDGVVPEGSLRTPAQAYKDVMSWLDRLEEGEFPTISRSPIKIDIDDLIQTDEKKNLRKYGDFSKMNQRWNHSSSQTLAKRLEMDDSEWIHYHQLYRDARVSWSVIPFEEFIRWAGERRGYEIGDFGCGEALVSEALSSKHTVHSFDHVAVNEDVIECDISNVPLDDETLDVALYSLSLMGSNFSDYLFEAHRVLKLDGQLHIWEATSRFKDLDSFERGVTALGFETLKKNVSDMFTHLQFVKVKSVRPSRDDVVIKF